MVAFDASVVLGIALTEGWNLTFLSALGLVHGSLWWWGLHALWSGGVP